MRRVLMTALMTAAAVAIATPASAAVTVTTTNGTPLTNQIFGDTTVNDAIHVYGTAPSNGGAVNVEYTGNTALHITNGFAQIQDAGTQGDLFQIIVNPNDLFDLMKFSVQLETAGTVTVYYLLSGSGLDANSILSYTSCGNSFCGTAGSFLSDANDNNNHLLSGGTFDGMMVSSSTGFSFFQLKQNSYDLAGTPPPPGAVPEPGTWGMMLLGFAGIGMAIRRSRKRTPALMQIA